ncbi:MAG TPA: 2-amino-4-hydroxy-6-hydroxymethyldihydropteridine diphosphokinase [Candidatus Methylomirabilis sp.]|nr:2-amino-4-hydroxy-6-hydroxymethyldihydropteridine diphosphokinase [Candidatus Methylomirabilis sp.]
MPRVYVSLGSNIDRETNLRTAVRELAAHYGRLTLSPVYESRAVGFDGGNFYNLVVGFDTEESPERIKETLEEIETHCGRRREGRRFSSRTLDLDLLLHGDTLRHDGRIDLPHPDIRRYIFVLRPLAEIAPDRRDPETRRTYGELWNAFNAGKTEIWKVEFDPGR